MDRRVFPQGVPIVRSSSVQQVLPLPPVHDAKLQSSKPPAATTSSRLSIDDADASGAEVIAAAALAFDFGASTAGGKQPSVVQSADSYAFAAEDQPNVARDAFLEELCAQPEADEDEEEQQQQQQQQPEDVEQHALTLLDLQPEIQADGDATDATTGPPAAAAATPAAAADRSQASFSIARSGTSALLGRMSMNVAKSAASASAALSRATTKLHEIALGDDHSVSDRWDTFDDDTKTTEKSARSVGTRGATSRLGRSSPDSAAGSTESPSLLSNSNSDTGELCKPAGATTPDLKVEDAESETTASSTDGTEEYDEYADAEAADKGLPVKPGFGLAYEHATVKLLLWYYVQTMLYSGLVAAVCIPLVTLASSLQWHVDVEVPDDQDGVTSPIQPNNPVFQWMLLFWIANPLTFYCPVLLACIKRRIQQPWQMYAICTFTLCWGTLACGLFYLYDVPFWFWYIDLFIIVAAYVPCMCVVGWFVEDRADATWRDRLWDVAFTATLETVVATATLLYCWFLMPLFYTLPSSWQKLVWLCFIHPLYFELTTGFIVRKALSRNHALGRTNITYFLSIVHSMAHQVSISTMLQASVEPTRILAVTVLVYNSSKLFWRSTVVHRHLLGDRILKGWSYNFTDQERTELARMVSVHVLTEVVLENASIMVTPYLMYHMYDEPLFMMVVPKTFHATSGTYPANTMAMMIFVMLSITVFFDGLFWLLNYHVTQFLPLINTWRRIKRAKGWYLAFLVYAFSFMGILFVFLVMMLLPRGTYCRSNNYCDCALSTYETVCQGGWFAEHHDYLVDIDSHTYI